MMLQPHLTSIASRAECTVLRLGLVGFAAEQNERVKAVMNLGGLTAICWEVGGFADADAWAVEGSRTQLLPDGSIRVASGIPQGRSVRFSLLDIDRPIAFSDPVAPSLLEPACRFDLNDPESVRQVLARFEYWLRPLTCQLCLAAQLIEHESELRSAVYHVCRKGQLLAVVDLGGGAGVLPTAAPDDFASAEWISRPSSARYIPETFKRVTLSELMWPYALRTTRDLLPERYRAGLIYYRRAPRLPHRMLKDSHLLLMRELSCAAASFEDLQQLTGMSSPRLAHDLAALYLVGSITSNPRRARPARTNRSDRVDFGSLQPSGRPSQSGAESPELDPIRWRPADQTAPAPMSALR